MIRTLIVDDERLARAELRRLLKAHPDIEIVGEAASASEARMLIGQLNPDLLLLDIQMPDGTGFDLLASLDSVPATVFTTAYNQHALQAFDYNALDYLLKPVEPAKLARALARFELPHGDADVSASIGLTSRPSRIFIKDGGRCWFAAVDNISLLESEGNYTRVYFDGNAPLILRTLAQFEAMLDPDIFIRTSRKHIVNLTHVANIKTVEGGGLSLQMSDGQLVQVSRRRAIEWKSKEEPYSTKP